MRKHSPDITAAWAKENGFTSWQKLEPRTGNGMKSRRFNKEKDDSYDDRPKRDFSRNSKNKVYK